MTGDDMILFPLRQMTATTKTFFHKTSQPSNSTPEPSVLRPGETDPDNPHFVPLRKPSDILVNEEGFTVGAQQWKFPKKEEGVGGTPGTSDTDDRAAIEEEVEVQKAKAEENDKTLSAKAMRAKVVQSVREVMQQGKKEEDQYKYYLEGDRVALGF